MKRIVLSLLAPFLLCGCAPGTNEQGPAHNAHRTASSPPVGVTGNGKSALGDPGPSYEVSIASAEADRVRARDLCDTGEKAERRACVQAADTAYDQAKSAAETSRNAAP